MRVLLATWGSRGDVQPLVALAVQLQALGADVRMSAPPDEEFAELLARAGVPFVPAFFSVRQWIAERTRPPINLPQLAAEMMDAQFKTLSVAAEGCDLLVAVGLFSATAAAQIVAEKLGIRYVCVAYCPFFLPSPHQRPFEFSMRPHPPGVTDNQVLWQHNIQTMNELFGGAFNTLRSSIGLPSVDNIRDHVITDHPLLASDPMLSPWQPTDDLHVVQTGAFILPDERPLSPELEAFLDSGTPPVYVGFGSMPMRTSEDAARVAIEAIRAQGHRTLLSRGWAELALIDDREDCFAVGEVNQQALFRRVAAVVHHGGAGTTTTAARAGAPQVIVPQIADQPYWASRVASLGIGVAHDGATATVDSLSTALAKALLPATRAQATQVAGEIRTDGASVGAKVVLEGMS
jgi:vancomycin aglycone glucosyltransferase